MTGIKVTMCCHGLGSSPKFSASIGDTVLVAKPDGLLQELTIFALLDQEIHCNDVNGKPVKVSPEQIKAVYLP